MFACDIAGFFSVTSGGFTCCNEPSGTPVINTIIPTFSAYCAQKKEKKKKIRLTYCLHLALLCVNLPSLAFSSTVLATMFSSSIKKILNAEVFGTQASAAKTASLSLYAVFSLFLVGIRAIFTHIKVVRDKTGCHRFACNVS